MTFEEEGGGRRREGGFGLGKDFTFPKPLVMEFFFLTYNGVRIFSSIIRHERYLFSG